MKRDEAIELIRLRTGQDAIAGWDERIRLEMEMAQTSLEWDPVLPWFLLTINDTLSITANTESFTLPNGFLRLGSQGGLYRYDGGMDDPWVALQRDSYDNLKARKLGVGTVQWYAILGDKIHLFPVTEINTSLRIIYYQSGGSLANNTATNPWLVHAPEVLLHLTSARVDPNRAALWTSLAETEKSRIRIHEDSRHSDGILIRILPE
ncbi:MAG: hypothetical protein HQL73_08245 [Magnetococcales bacterium]|nr:hypothetical protein [Magnetococcales bacterium]